jgi:hypothetical protein
LIISEKILEERMVIFKFKFFEKNLKKLLTKKATC